LLQWWERAVGNPCRSGGAPRPFSLLPPLQESLTAWQPLGSRRAWSPTSWYGISWRTRRLRHSPLATPVAGSPRTASAPTAPWCGLSRLRYTPVYARLVSNDRRTRKDKRNANQRMTIIPTCHRLRNRIACDGLWEPHAGATLQPQHPRAGFAHGEGHVKTVAKGQSTAAQFCRQIRRRVKVAVGRNSTRPPRAATEPAWCHGPAMRSAAGRRRAPTSAAQLALPVAPRILVASMSPVVPPCIQLAGMRHQPCRLVSCCER